MQNAKCKMNGTFCFAKANFMVNCINSHRQNLFVHKGYLLLAFCIDPLSRSPILHFALREQPDKPKFEILATTPA